MLLGNTETSKTIFGRLSPCVFLIFIRGLNCDGFRSTRSLPQRHRPAGGRNTQTGDRLMMSHEHGTQGTSHGETGRQGGRASRTRALGWLAVGAAGLAVSLALLPQALLGPAARTQVDRMHPFLVESAEANHIANTRVEAVQIWVCDVCHLTQVTLTDGTTRVIATGDAGGGGTQTVSQGQEWGATVAGVFGGKHAPQSTDLIGQTADVYANYLDRCYGPGTNAAMITGAYTTTDISGDIGSEARDGSEPCNAGGGVAPTRLAHGAELLGSILTSTGAFTDGVAAPRPRPYLMARGSTLNNATAQSTTLSITYLDQAGASSTTTQTVSIPAGTSTTEVMVALAAGDTGVSDITALTRAPAVTAVATVQLYAAEQGTDLIARYNTTMTTWPPAVSTTQMVTISQFRGTVANQALGRSVAVIGELGTDPKSTHPNSNHNSIS